MAAGGSVCAEVAGAAVGVVVGARVGARVRGAACGRLGAAKWGKKKNGVTHSGPRAPRGGSDQHRQSSQSDSPPWQ